jgi:membrane protease YdiL (CAAX protease family)
VTVRIPGSAGADEHGDLATFFGIVTALSIPFWIAGAVIQRPVGTPLGLSAGSLMIVAPVLAASLLTWQRGGLRDVGRLLRRTVDIRRPRLGWYAFAALSIPAILTASWGWLVLIGRPLPEPAFDVSALPPLVVVYALAAAAEEVGWSGYAIGRLLVRWSPLRSALVLGGFTALWHVVAIAEAGRDPGWIAWQCLFLVAARVLVVWIYRATDGSVLATILFHTTINLGASLFPNGGSAYDPAITAIATVGVAAATVTPAARSPLRRAAAVISSQPRREPEGGL